MLETGSLMVNGSPVGDLYAAAVFPRQLRDQEWPRAYFLRELTEEQLTEAYQLGVRLAMALKEGRVKAYDPLANFSQSPGSG